MFYGTIGSGAGSGAGSGVGSNGKVGQVLSLVQVRSGITPDSKLKPSRRFVAVASTMTTSVPAQGYVGTALLLPSLTGSN